MAEPLLTKDTINVAGHKFPIALVGGIAAAAMVVVVLRARQQGQNVASAGQAPRTAAETGFGLPLPGADVGPALANLSQQLTDLRQSSISAPAPAQLGETATLSKMAYPGFGQVPLFSSPGTAWQGLIAGWQDAGTSIRLTGVSQTGPASEGQPGSTLWYQTTTGQWVNANELSNLLPVSGSISG
jgi:hypothetical protein